MLLLGPCPSPFRCKNTGACLTFAQLLNGVNDCGDNSDEDACYLGLNNCPPGSTCLANVATRQFMCLGGNSTPICAAHCKNSGACLTKEQLLNGVNNCGDNSDEDACYLGLFVCPPNSLCLANVVSRTYMCLGLGSNTTSNCSARCANSQVCLPITQLLDGVNNCGDWSDEDACYLRLNTCPNGTVCVANTTAHTYTCVAGGNGSSCVYRCRNNGACLTQPQLLNGVFDCTDRSDEDACYLGLFTCPANSVCFPNTTTHNYTCLSAVQSTTTATVGGQCASRCRHNGACLVASQLLNGANDCGDSSDEDACYLGRHNCTGRSLCLANIARRSFICFGGDVQPITTPAPSPGATTVAGSGQCLMRCRTTNLTCITQSMVLNGVNDCGDNSDEDICYLGLANCPPEARCLANIGSRSYACLGGPSANGSTCSYHCRSTSTCISSTQALNGVNDCPDGSDEDACYLGLASCPSGAICVPTQTPQAYICLVSVTTTAPGGGSTAVVSAGATPAACVARCRNTNMCLVPSQLLDGVNDCGDNSDEDVCYLGRHNCSQGLLCLANTADRTFTCMSPNNPGQTTAANGGGQTPMPANPAQTTAAVQTGQTTMSATGVPTASSCAARCRNTGACLQSSQLLDGVNDCGDNSDEDGCYLGRFTCNQGGICLANIPARSFSCLYPPGVGVPGSACAGTGTGTPGCLNGSPVPATTSPPTTAGPAVSNPPSDSGTTRVGGSDNIDCAADPTSPFCRSTMTTTNSGGSGSNGNNGGSAATTPVVGAGGPSGSGSPSSSGNPSGPGSSGSGGVPAGGPSGSGSSSPGSAPGGAAGTPASAGQPGSGSPAGTTSGCAITGPIQDCAAIQCQQRRTGMGTVTLNTPGLSKPTLSAFCDFDTEGGGWTIIQRRTNGSVDFWRNWADYKTGFGTADATSEMWLGNEFISGASRQDPNGYQLLIKMISLGGEQLFHALYSPMVVDTEANNYTLTLGLLIKGNTSADHLAYLTNSGFASARPFSTYDHKTDGNPYINCGVYLQSGWWMEPNCSVNAGNLNVPYNPRAPLYPHLNGIVWAIERAFVRMRFTQMQIRPIWFTKTLQTA